MYLGAGYLQITQAVIRLGRATELSLPKSEDGERVVALDAESVAVLNRRRETQNEERRARGSAWQNTGLVFAPADGGQLHPDLVTDTFTRLAAATGLPPIRLHDLRHPAASSALQAGVPLKVVSELLGHCAIAIAITADTYTSVLPEGAAAAADAVAGIIPRKVARAGQGPADSATQTGRSGGPASGGGKAA